MGELLVMDELRYPLFMGLQSLLYKLTLCILRRARAKEDGFNAAISGFVSGLSLLLLKDPQIRKLFGLYTLIRACKLKLDIQESQGKLSETQM